MKYKVTIKRVEYYSLGVIVEADSADDAIKKVSKAEGECSNIGDDLTDGFDDASTDYEAETASENDIKDFKDLKDYDYE